MSYGMAEAFFTAEELVVAEAAHRGVGVAEGVHLAEEVRKAGGIRLTNLLESVLVKSYGGERLARVLDGREGCDRASGLGDHRTSSMLSSLRVPEGSYLSGNPCRMRTGAPARSTRRISRAARARSGMVKDEGEPRGVCRFIRQR